MSTLVYLLLHAHFGIGTIFSAVDKFNPNPELACLHRPLDDARDLVVAHPTLPCRSRVWLYNPRTRRGVVARVGDRGPHAAMIDLAPRTARALRANGKEMLFMMAVGK